LYKELLTNYQVSYEQLRSQFASVGEMSQADIAEISRRLEFPVKGSGKEMYKYLLEILEVNKQAKHKADDIMSGA